MPGAAARLIECLPSLGHSGHEGTCMRLQDGATRKTERRSVDPEQREAEAEAEQAAPALPPAAGAAVQPAISTQAPAAGAPIAKVPRTAAPSGLPRSPPCKRPRQRCVCDVAGGRCCPV